MVFQPKLYFEGNIAKENCSLFLKILCFFQLGGWAWAYIRNGPNAAASIAPTLIRPCSLHVAYMLEIYRRCNAHDLQSTV